MILSNSPFYLSSSCSSASSPCSQSVNFYLRFAKVSYTTCSSSPTTQSPIYVSIKNSNSDVIPTPLSLPNPSSTYSASIGLGNLEPNDRPIVLSVLNKDGSAATPCLSAFVVDGNTLVSNSNSLTFPIGVARKFFHWNPLFRYTTCSKSDSISSSVSLTILDASTGAQLKLVSLPMDSVSKQYSVRVGTSNVNLSTTGLIFALSSSSSDEGCLSSIYAGKYLLSSSALWLGKPCSNSNSPCSVRQEFKVRLMNLTYSTCSDTNSQSVAPFTVGAGCSSISIKSINYLLFFFKPSREGNSVVDGFLID